MATSSGYSSGSTTNMREISTSDTLNKTTITPESIEKIYYGTNDLVEDKLFNSNSDANLYNNSGYDISVMGKMSPYIHDEVLAHEVLSKAGPALTYQRKEYSHDIGMAEIKNSNYQDFKTSNLNSEYSKISGSYSDYVNVIKINTPSEITASSSAINQDPDPIRIVKPNIENLVYKQKVSNYKNNSLNKN